jgi:hypothetical protein
LLYTEKLHFTFERLNSILMKKYTFIFCCVAIVTLPATHFAQAPAIAWQNTIGGNQADNFTCINSTTDGGYIVCGYSSSAATGDKTENKKGLDDYWVLKLSAIGVVEWQNTIGGSKQDRPVEIIQTPDGGYIVGGTSESNISDDKTENKKGVNDYWVVKLDSLGNVEWDNTIGGNSVDELKSIKLTPDGGYIVGGNSSSDIGADKSEASISGSADYWVVKLDAAGNIEWDKVIGGTFSDFLTSVLPTVDGGYIVGGTSYSGIGGDKSEALMGSRDYWVVKLDSTGNIEWENTIGANNADDLSDLKVTPDGGYILGGESWYGTISGDKTEDYIGINDFWVIKLDAVGNILWQNTIGSNSNEYFSSISVVSGNAYVFCGYTNGGISGDKIEDNMGPSYTTDIWVVKLDSIGNIVWQNIIGGSDSEDTFGYGEYIIETPDNGYILGCASKSDSSGDKTENSNGEYDYWLIKLEPECNLLTFYADADGDSYGDASMTTMACSAPIGYVSDNTDCNDGDASVNTGATEVCNSVDDNCDGNIDEGVATASITPAGPVSFCKGSFVTLSANTGTGYTYQWYKNENPVTGATSSTYNATKPGNYQVEVTIPGGCTALSEAIVASYLPNPNASINTPEGTDLCVDSSLKIKASNQPDYSYQWYKDGSPISGETNYLYQATTIGVYKCLVTNSSGCSKYTAEVTIINTCRKDALEVTRMHVNPNPTNNSFLLEMTIPGMISGSAEVEIMNLMGQQITFTNSDIKDGRITASFTFSNTAAAGIYLLRVRVQGESYITQVILTR